jgi:threonine dehydratase
MPLFTLDELHDAAASIRTVVPPTPAYAWPLLAKRVGATVVVKHENHTPIGAFKVRGGLIYVNALCRVEPNLKGLVTATRGNHGQSIALAAVRNKVPVVIVVPEGNSREKNAAMEAFGAELVTAGKDFDESRDIPRKSRSSAAITTYRRFTAISSGASRRTHTSCSQALPISM